MSKETIIMISTNQEQETASSSKTADGSWDDSLPRVYDDQEIRRRSTCPSLLLRYPGSKSRARYAIVAKLIRMRRVPDVEYREPFYGNGTILPCLLSMVPNLRYAWINDADPGISAVWNSVIASPDGLAEMIRETRPTTGQFWKAKEILSGDPIRLDEMDRNQIALLKILVHRTSFSGYGVMSGGPLGGKHQGGPCRVDSRWNPDTLIQTLHDHHDLFRQLAFRTGGCTTLDFEEVIGDEEAEAVLYLDPPYYGVGHKLYQHSMPDRDHRRLASCLRATPHHWLLSYDDCPEIRALYSDWATIEYLPIPYSCARRRVERELLISNRHNEIEGKWSHN